MGSRGIGPRFSGLEPLVIPLYHDPSINLEMKSNLNFLKAKENQYFTSKLENFSEILISSITTLSTLTK